MYDIAIIGAGPAGATAARLLAGKYRTLLVDARDLSAPPRFSLRKCCGGLLAPDAQAMLSCMGLGLPRAVLQDPQLFVVRAIDAERGRERFYQRHYINMDRLAFDQWLLSLVPSDSVDIRLGVRLRRCECEKDGVRLTFRDGTSERSRFLIGADGPASTVRRQLLPNSPGTARYIAIQEWAEVRDPMPYFSSLFDHRITDYYGWTIPKGERLALGVALRPRQNPLQRFELFRQRLREQGIDAGRVIEREGALVLRPLSGGGMLPGTDRAALIGEAGGWISPSSAEGLSYAFRTASLVNGALESGIKGAGARYAKACRPLRRKLLAKAWKSKVIFGGTARALIMRTGLLALDVPIPFRTPRTTETGR